MAIVSQIDTNCPHHRKELVTKTAKIEIEILQTWLECKNEKQKRWAFPYWVIFALLEI